jgi:hypothetical protein
MWFTVRVELAVATTRTGELTVAPAEGELMLTPAFAPRLITTIATATPTAFLNGLPLSGFP